MSLISTSEPSREDVKADFLKRNGFGELRRERLPGDASTRSYERLHRPDGGTLILMDQPPLAESPPCPDNATPEERVAMGYNASARLAAGRVDAFAAVAAYLNGRGLSAPKVLALNTADGLAVLEDLGDQLFARILEGGEAETPLYDAAIDVLAHLHAERPPAVLEGYGAAWPFLAYDELALRIASDIFIEWLPQFAGAPAFSPEAVAEWEAFWAPVRLRGEAGADVFCHRDYHAENLLWLGDRDGVARVGLLDFQDAVRAHRAWDLSMLLHDARRDISPELRRACLERYANALPNLDRQALVADFSALGALNIVRILGIFSRLVHRDGKPRYRSFMPRMWGYLDECAADPSLSELRGWLDRHVSPEMRA